MNIINLDMKAIKTKRASCPVLPLKPSIVKWKYSAPDISIITLSDPTTAVRGIRRSIEVILIQLHQYQPSQPFHLILRV